MRFGDGLVRGGGVSVVDGAGAEYETPGVVVEAHPETYLNLYRVSMRCKRKRQDPLVSIVLGVCTFCALNTEMCL
jgi:hypothetical protein